MENNNMKEDNHSESEEKVTISKNFIEMIIDKDLEEGKVKNIVTFFPIEDAPFAIIKEAIALSKSLLKTTSV